MAREDLKKHWIPTEDAFRGLLAWLDEGVDSGGNRYLEMRRRLVSYFDRRDCPFPDENADETLNRVARRLEEQGTIVAASPAHFCYLTAKFVFLESIRTADQERRLEAETIASRAASSPASLLTTESDDLERLMRCLESCIETLDSSDQELILDYYKGERREKIDGRRRLAEHLGLTLNAVTIRAARIRNRLEHCVGACMAGGETKSTSLSHQSVDNEDI